MTATVIPAAVFAAHANKLRAIRLEKLAQSIRRPNSVNLAQRRPVSAAVPPQKQAPRPSLFGR